MHRAITIQAILAIWLFLSEPSHHNCIQTNSGITVQNLTRVLHQQFSIRRELH